MSAFSPKNLITIARVSFSLFKFLYKLFEIYKISSFALWITVIVILSLFFGGLLLNYIIKKINETRLENRFTGLKNRVSTNQSTQVQRPIKIDNRTIIPSGQTAENPNNGISFIFNKEENLLEDKRRKEQEDLPKNSSTSDCVVINMENVVEENSSLNSKDEEINRSVFLGAIYKELYEKRAAIDKCKSLSNDDRDSILNEIVDKMVWKINESKSTPSIKKLIDIQTENELKEWALDLVRKKEEASASASNSGCC